MSVNAKLIVQFDMILTESELQILERVQHVAARKDETFSIVKGRYGFTAQPNGNFQVVIHLDDRVLESPEYGAWEVDTTPL